MVYEGGYEISVAEELFRKEMNAWKEKKLNKPFIFTEYGADTLASEHKLPSVMWSQEYQDEYLKMTHEVFDSYDFIKENKSGTLQTSRPQRESCASTAIKKVSLQDSVSQRILHTN